MHNRYTVRMREFTHTYSLETAATVLGALIMIIAAWLFVYNNTQILTATLASHEYLAAIQRFVFTLTATLLIYGAFVYVLTRLGHLRRFRYHTSVPDAEIEKKFFGSTEEPPSLTVLIPEYKEERVTIEMTMLSAALLTYPDNRVVLLIDDNPSPASNTDESLLKDAQTLPNELQTLLNEQKHDLENAYASFQERTAHTFDPVTEISMLNHVYRDVGTWFEKQLARYSLDQHIEHFFTEFILKANQNSYEQDATFIHDHGMDMERDELAAWCDRKYRKAIAQFNADITYFQRKQYANLPHEANKAMNLNSYLSLIGNRYNYRHDRTGIMLLERTENDDADLTIPSTDYVITIDADSIVSSQYAARLIEYTERPENKDIAVIQTPYKTYPCSLINLERIAGATTDIQHLVHQGFTACNASFWVGANALLRYRALKDIKEQDTERGYPIERFIQDTTVIEDTESTVDLAYRGWRIHNYPAALAYSATPPDFGSLLIQRRRWANGGLIIFPKLLRYLFVGPHTLLIRLVEFFIRAHYLLSIAFINIGLVILFLYPFDGELFVAYLITASLPYFIFYARDLARLGYSVIDLLRVYALNLALVPINLGGVVKSVQQLIFRTKIPFGRTPKVHGRTLAPHGYIIAEIGITAYLLIGGFIDIYFQRYEHAIFSLVNALFFVYGVVVFIGPEQIWERLIPSPVLALRPVLFRYKHKSINWLSCKGSS